jgi:GT2 family glycosyltransferase
MTNWPHTRQKPVHAGGRNGQLLNGMSMRGRIDLLRLRLTDREIRGVLDAGLFDPEFYLDSNADVKAAGIHPLEHYLRWGKKEGRKPSEHFDQGAFAQCLHSDTRNRDRIGAFCNKFGLPVEPLEEVLAIPGLLAAANDPDFVRAYALADQSGLFDPDYYRSQVPVSEDVDPLAHYLIWGHHAFLDPSPSFNSAEYDIVNADSKSVGMNPLLRWLDHGRPAGRPMSVAEREARRNKTARVPIGLTLPEQIQLESMRGTAYLARYGFSLEKTSSLEHAARAISDLAARKPKFSIAAETPDVSIIIPLHGQLQVSLNCLDALSRQTSRRSAEIVLVDDASPADAGVDEIAKIPWVRHLKLARNKGFVGACNSGASEARGKYLVFLNNDTRVLPGWLDELIGSFELFPKAGLVGSKLINDDGSLQEAGGIAWRDGSVWNYGRGESPERPEFCYARRVDYCSGASIAVSANAWRELGGFDFVYSPAYCEDLDFAFKLRRAGYEVWLQPLSLVIHYEGRSHGRDVGGGIKSYQVRNLRTFYTRWRDILLDHGMPKPFPHVEANRTKRQSVLVLDAQTPTPDRDSGSVNTIELMRLFLHMGWHVAFAPRNHLYEGRYTSDLQRLGIEVMIGPCVSHLGDIIENRPDAYDTIFAFRFESLNDCYDRLREAYPKARIIFHDIDLHHLRLQRRADLLGDRTLRMEAELVKDKELELFVRCDCSIVVTEAEKQVIEGEVPLDNIVVYPYTMDVQRSEEPFEQRRHLCFIGGYAHDPNIDAVQYFVHEIWPLVKPRLPRGSKFFVVGPGAPESILSLAADDIVITGYVPDLKEVLDDCRISVVPLRYGAGIKGKLVRTLAWGLPSVATTLAVEGMGLRHGREVLVADDPRAFAEAIVRLFNERDTWLSIQNGGYEFVEENYSWRIGLETCRRILDIADETWIARKTAARKLRLAELLNPGRLKP